jgi:D-3-phosphoglycerate dehydrogenase
LGRDREGGSAIALVQVDGRVPEAALAGIQRIEGVKQAKVLSF